MYDRQSQQQLTELSFLCKFNRSMLYVWIMHRWSSGRLRSLSRKTQLSWDVLDSWTASWLVPGVSALHLETDCRLCRVHVWDGIHSLGWMGTEQRRIFWCSSPAYVSAGVREMYADLSRMGLLLERCSVWNSDLLNLWNRPLNFWHEV